MRAAAAILLLLAVAPIAAAEGERAIDARALLRKPVEDRPPILGLSRCGSPIVTVWEGPEEKPPSDWLTPGDLAWLRPGEDADGAIVASIARDLLRIVRVRIELQTPGGFVPVGEIRARPGSWASWGPIESRRLLLEADVEIACDNSGGYRPSAIADPVVATVLTGFSVAVRPFLLDDAGAVALEAVVQSSEIEESVPSFPLRARWHGSLDLPRAKGTIVAASGRGGLTLWVASRDGERAVHLVPEVLGEAGSGPRRLLDAGILTRRPGLLEEYDDTVDGDVWGADFVRGAATVAQRAPTVGAPVTRSLPWIQAGPFVMLAGTAEEVAAAERDLAALAAPAARMVYLVIRLHAGEEVVAFASGSALAGREALFRAGEERMLVVDSEVEVGCFIQIADPIVVPLFTGFYARATPRVSPGGDSILVDLDLRLTALDGEPEVRPIGDAVNGSIHTVRLVRREAAADLLIPDRGVATLSLGRAPDGRPLTATISALVER